MGKKRTSLEVYLSVVFKWGLLILVSACMCATATFVTEKLIGLYPTVPWIAVLLFACWKYRINQGNYLEPLE